MTEQQQKPKIVDLLKTAADFFAEKKIDEPRLSAERLLGHVLGMERIELYLNHERPLFEHELESFRELCRQRLRKRPVQYITGEQIFYGYRFAVDERVLIPRPETELLVEHALERAAQKHFPEGAVPQVLDIGTGSGCIAVTLALKLPGAFTTAIDISSDALRVAAANAELHHVADRIRLLKADALGESFCCDVQGPFSLVVSNPPYIPEREWEELQDEVRIFEPRNALVSPDGFEYYRAVISNAPRLLSPGGLLCFELHADAASTVRSLMREQGFSGIELMQDYSGLDRVLSGICHG
jgi:release factor glutamine methyltransferase